MLVGFSPAKAQALALPQSQALARVSRVASEHLTASLRSAGLVPRSLLGSAPQVVSRPSPVPGRKSEPVLVPQTALRRFQVSAGQASSQGQDRRQASPQFKVLATSHLKMTSRLLQS